MILSNTFNNLEHDIKFQEATFSDGSVTLILWHIKLWILILRRVHPYFHIRMEMLAAVWLRGPCELCSHLPIGIAYKLASGTDCGKLNFLCKVEFLYPRSKTLRVKRSLRGPLNPLNPNAHGLIGAEILSLSIPCGISEHIICSSNSSNC